MAATDKAAGRASRPPIRQDAEESVVHSVPNGVRLDPGPRLAFWTLAFLIDFLGPVAMWLAYFDAGLARGAVLAHLVSIRALNALSGAS